MDISVSLKFYGYRYRYAEFSWILPMESHSGANHSRKSTEHQAFINKRRQMPVNPLGYGLWNGLSEGVGSRHVRRYEPQHELRAAVKMAGYDLEDIKTVIISHLHVDHAGGLDDFLDRSEVEIWVHEKEFHSAFWSVGTGMFISVVTNIRTFNNRRSIPHDSQ
jgi:hypothetical protein